MKISGVDANGTLRDVLVDASGRVLLSTSTITPVDGSGTITLGGTAQDLFGGVTPTTGYEIFNPGTASLWISKHGTATPNTAGSIEILPGTMYNSPSNYIPNHKISIYGASTAQPFTAEMF